MVQKKRIISNVTTEELEDISEILDTSTPHCAVPPKVLTTGKSFLESDLLGFACCPTEH